jgi:transcriptional regulator with XRE-family HTH domain
MSFAEELKRRRKTLNLSQKDLALKAEIGNVQISTYEKGKVVPSLITMRKLAVALELEENYFITLEKTKLNDDSNYQDLLIDSFIRFYKKNPTERKVMFLKRVIDRLAVDDLAEVV